MIAFIGFLIGMYLFFGCFKLGQKYHDAKMSDIPYGDFFKIVYGWGYSAIHKWLSVIGFYILYFLLWMGFKLRILRK